VAAIAPSINSERCSVTMVSEADFIFCKIQSVNGEVLGCTYPHPQEVTLFHISSAGQVFSSLLNGGSKTEHMVAVNETR
jgi:hypothetical protein